MFRGYLIKLGDIDVTYLIFQHLILYRWNLDGTAFHMKRCFLCIFSTKNGDIYISTFLTADIFFYHQVQIFACDRFTIYLVQDIPRKHTGFKSRRIGEYLDRRDDSSGPVLLYHHTDPTIFTTCALHQGLILLRIVIHGIWIVQTIHQASINAVFHLLGVFIKQKILVDDPLDILHFG